MTSTYTPVAQPESWESRPRRALNGTERCALLLLADHERPDAEIARLAQCDERDAAFARSILEDSGASAIERWPSLAQHDAASAIETLSMRKSSRHWLSGMAAINAARQRCKRGHKLTPDNVSWIRDAKTGSLVRRCKACHRIRERTSRGLPPDYVPVPLPKDRDRCPAGHLYEGDNLVIITKRDGSKVRRCRTCHNAQARERARARRERQRQARELAALIETDASMTLA